MEESIPSKTTNLAHNKLARELMEARPKLRQRALMEGQIPYYKVSTLAS